MWVLEYWNEIESDMSVFHRVDDVYAMEGPKFFRFAFLLPRYKGVLQARLREEFEEGHHTRSSGYNKEEEEQAAKWGARLAGTQTDTPRVEGLPNDFQEHADMFDVTIV